MVKKAVELEKDKFLEQCKARIGVVTEWAALHNFNPVFVYRVVNGDCRPSKRFLAAVGAERLPEKYRFLEGEG